jgi:hypothetical protein
MSTIAIGDIAGRTPGSASPTKDGWPTPAISGGTIGIDTISHGVLTAVRMPRATSSRVRDTRVGSGDGQVLRPRAD